MVTYAELLIDNKWKSKRLEILHRDKNNCQNCNNEILLISPLVKRLLIDKNASKFYNSFLRKWEITQYYLDKPVFLEINPNVFDKQSEYIAFYLDNENTHEGILLGLVNTNETGLTKFDGYKIDNAGDFSKEDLIKQHRKLIEKEIENHIKSHIGIIEQKKKSIKWSYVYGISVHHLCYRFNKMPWEYDNNDLITLCMFCHESLHKESKVPQYDENNELIRELTPCKRCFGEGWFPEYEHVNNGICYRCGGMKYEEFISH